MNELLCRLQEITNLSWESPGAAARLNILTDHVRTIMRSYAFLSERGELSDIIASTPVATKAADQEQFLQLKYNVIRHVKKFWTTFKQIELV